MAEFWPPFTKTTLQRWFFVVFNGGCLATADKILECEQTWIFACSVNAPNVDVGRGNRTTLQGISQACLGKASMHTALFTI